MQIPEPPRTAEELDLMRRLRAYADGDANWNPGQVVGPSAKAACRSLYDGVLRFIDKVLNPLLDRIGAREMDNFTMHDRMHGAKVAHLMWQILSSSRRDALTPPEIGMLVLSAYIHDLGMALSTRERRERLAEESDLWTSLEIDEQTRFSIQKLRDRVGSPDQSTSRRAKLELDQAEEALLCRDTRSRHATRERYEMVFQELREFHGENPENIPSIDECLSFDGESFRERLIEICVSHNQDAQVLVSRNPKNLTQPLLPRDYPIGRSTVDLHMIAAALRLADILDFDRERTPPVLFYYLIPAGLSPAENRSVLEWRKHMAISNWRIDEDAVIFRGVCRDHIVHHAVVQFCAAIQEEISETRATFGPMQEEVSWPFRLPSVVKAEIHEEGYRYVPYRFELDDQRIYRLLMGGAIYDEPLVAVRELVQNAVDACRLRDALTQVHEPYVPIKNERIFVRYEEPDAEHGLPSLSVTDTGTGMDAFILERYFLKVGRSYYNSAEFNYERAALRKRNLDFAPISEFGIGFLSCFLLADHVEVESALWEPRRGDSRKRTLSIDGPTRLICLSEDSNEGPVRYKGTSVRLLLCRGGKGRETRPPSWDEIRTYLLEICQDLPYRIELQHLENGELSEDFIDPKPFHVEVAPSFELGLIRIAVNDEEFGLEGEIALTNLPKTREIQRQLAIQTSQPMIKGDHEIEAERRLRFHYINFYSELFRGGLKIGEVPGLPRHYLDIPMARSKLRLTWNSRKDRRYFGTNLARNRTVDDLSLAQNVARVWLSYLLQHRAELQEGQLYQLDCPITLGKAFWLERFNAYEVYSLAAQGWQFELKQGGVHMSISEWENGTYDRLWLGEHKYDLHGELLDLVLPRVTSLVLGAHGRRYVKRPIQNWREVLHAWTGYVSHPVKWGRFVEYDSSINTLLWYKYPGCEIFNIRYSSQLETYSDEDLQLLLDAFGELIESRENGRLASLKHAESLALVRAMDSLADMSIGGTSGSWKLRSFPPPAPPKS